MNEKECKRIFALLSDYLEGDLKGKSCRELERHLAGCKPCLAYIESLKSTVEALRQFNGTGTSPRVKRAHPRQRVTPKP